MSKVKLKVGKAVRAFKQNVDKRNVNNTESEIASFIDDQIDIKNGEIVVIEKEILKYTDQNERDFIEGLAIFEETSITTVRDREAYAQRYVISGISKMNSNKIFTVNKQDQINELKKEISDLSEFRKILENIEINTEEITA